MPVDRPRARRARTRSATRRITTAALAATTALSTVVGAALASAAPGAGPTIAAADQHADLTIWPAPRELTPRDDGFRLTPVVGLVAGEDTDPSALDAVRRTLQDAGVRRVADGADAARTPVTVWLDAGDDVLAELGVTGADELAAEGYVLAAGRDPHGRRHVVLDGVDADGSYYAADTFAQLIEKRPGLDHVPGVEIRDEPAMTYRGAIEGFYGTPWTHRDRLALLDYLGTHRMNTFEYAPKDDPYHRQRWRDPYPAEDLDRLGELVGRAGDNRVDFTFALSPGLSICYSSQEDFDALVAKFDALYELGTRSFNIPLDDIDYDTWHCDADADRFGTGAAAAGRAQAHLLNRVQREWVETKGDVAPLQMVPTEYHNVTESPYKRELREGMDDDVVVMWTGTAVVPEHITVADAERARDVFGHEILVWDNYPVNDYAAGRLLLAPYSGRENGLSDQVAGVVSNPMNQAALSELALYSFAEFGWNDTDYDATRSWRDAARELAGGDTDLAAAVETFADLNWYDGRLHHTQSPALAEEIESFWRDREAGHDKRALARLRAVFDEYATATQRLRDLPDDRAVTELDAWLRAAQAWLAAGEASLDMLAAHDAGDHDTAWERRVLVARLIDEATSVRDEKEPHSSTWPRLGDGVLDTHLADAVEEVDAAFGVGAGIRQATTTLATYRDHSPANMVDGDEDTVFWSSRAPREDDHVEVDLGEPTEIGRVDVLMGSPDTPDDFLPEGVLEYSLDGADWTTLTTATTPEVSATAPDGTQARYVRYRATTDSDFWLLVREFTVEAPELVTFTVDGDPPAEEGGNPASVIDGDPASAYVAARPAEEGEALVVTPSRTRPWEHVTVLQSPRQPVSATVQIQDPGGDWITIGDLTGGHTRLPVDGQKVAALRLLWDGGTPHVHEIAPAFAD